MGELSPKGAEASEGAAARASALAAEADRCKAVTARRRRMLTASDPAAADRLRGLVQKYRILAERAKIDRHLARLSWRPLHLFSPATHHYERSALLQLYKTAHFRSMVDKSNNWLREAGVTGLARLRRGPAHRRQYRRFKCLGFWLNSRAVEPGLFEPKLHWT
jgi:hypothetical protein